MRVSARTVATIGAIGLGLSNLGRIPSGALGGRSAPLVVADVVVVLVWLVLAMAMASRRMRIVVDDVMAAAGAFVAAAAVSTALAFFRYSVGVPEGAGIVAFLIRWVAYFGWYPFVVWCLTDDESRAAWRDIEIALLVFAAFGLIQSAFLPGFAQIIHDSGDLPTWDIQGRRLVSTVLDPNFAGILIVIALLFRLSRVAEGLHENIAAMVILTAGILLTVSRSALLALVVGVLVLVIARGIRQRLFRVLVGGAVLVLPFLSLLTSFASGFNKLRYDNSAAQRLVPWTRAVRLIAEYPGFGVGFNAIKQAQESHGWRSVGGADVSLDGGLLFVAAMTGLVGVSLYVLMLTRVVLGARRAWRDSDVPAEDRAHATATAAATIAVVVHSLFVNSLLLPFVMQVLWVMWGRLAHIRASRRARLGLAVAVPLALALAGCDPCAGTVSCSTSSPHATVTGAIVDHITGKGVAGARIDAHLTGSGGFSATASAGTGSDGGWEITVNTLNLNPVQATITVTSPGAQSYTADAASVTPTSRTGEATALGMWNDVPAIRYLVTLLHNGVPLVGADVHFTGTNLAGITALQTDASTNGAGIFELDAAGQTLSQISGVLTVTHPSLTHPSVLQGFTIPLDYHFGIPAPRATFPVGPRL
ncbi:MAG: O-antigen ligase family protein, partial [Gemmatimonadaceae bacterium]